MPTYASQLASQLLQSEGLSLKGAVLTVIFGMIAVTALSVYFTDRPYDKFPMCGKDDSTKTSWQAKQRWLSSAKKILTEGFQTSKVPFQVVANCGPLIVLHPSLMNEARNDDRMTFRAWLKQHFFTTYPGFQGFVPAATNNVFVKSVRMGLTQTLGRATEILDEETQVFLAEKYPYSEEWKEIYLDQDAAQMIARLSTAIFMPALARNEEWLKIAVDYTVHFFTGAYVLRMIPPPLRPIVHWFLPFTRQLRLTVPYYFITPPAPATTKNLDINFYVNDTGSFLWTLGGESFRANYNNPVLLLADQGNFSYPAEWNVQNFGSNSSIRIIVNNPTPAAHPMQIHGHNMQILHEGSGNWDGTSLTNPNNPQRRDVQQVRAFGHMVMQFTADNPGVWPFHCHIAWHVSAGLYANILERPADIQSQDYQVPLIMQQTCRDWTTYSNNNVVDEIDSGL